MASTWIRPRPTRRSSWWSRWRPVKWSWPSSPSAWPSGRTSAEPNSPADPSADPSRATRDPSGRQQLPRADEDAVEHGLGEAAGRGVLLADVVAAEQRAVLGKGSLGAVGETGLGADGAEVAQRGVPGVVAEGDHHADRVQERQLPPGDQARAPAALDQLPVEPLQFVARGHRDSLPRQRGKIIPPVPGRNPRPSLSVT